MIPQSLDFPAENVNRERLIAEAAIRETFEETGITVYDCVLVYKRVEPPSHPGGEPFYAYAYYAEAWSGEPERSEEGVVKWVTAHELITNLGAFPDYNRDTLESFRKMFPDVYLEGE